METNSLQVQELHKKFEALNDEISLALKHQEDALADGTSSSIAAPRREALRLAKRAIDWREDANALAKHIDLQLQHSRALRNRELEVLHPAGESKTPEQDDGAKLRCLRSDLRLLQTFRLSYVHGKGGGQDKDADALLEDLEADGKALNEVVERSIKREKSSDAKDSLTSTIVELFETRRELMGRISEDILKDKKQLDLEVGILDLMGGGGRTGGAGVDSDDKEVLASWDTQQYIKLVQALLDLQKEMKERFSGGHGQQQPPLARSTTTNQEHVEFAGTTTGGGHGGSPPPKTGAMIDEVNFTLQKLRRELGDLKAAYAKSVMANSQLEDDLANLQRKYEEEKRAHVNEKKWYVPKIQKLEETVLTTAKAYEGLKLNVELITNMYKTLSQTLSTFAVEEHELRRERDHVTGLLSTEIKKVAMLTKEANRKEKLVTIAMAARHEMCELAKRCERRVQELEKDKQALEHRTMEQGDELAVLKIQIDAAYGRLEATDGALGSAKATITRLQQEMEVCVEAAAAKETELRVTYEGELAAQQQRLDKAKKDLLDAMSQNLSLDGRLRKTQEKLNRLSGGAAAGGPA